MEIRRIQKTGGGSYVITLPKEWVTSLGIKEKDQISIITQPDSTLILSANATSTKQEKREKIFNIDEIGDEGNGRKTVLYRMLIGAYIMGFENYRIYSSGKISSTTIKTVTDFVNTALGPVIDEQTKNTIILKDILNPTEMPFENNIRRMHVIIKTMHDDLMDAFQSQNADTIHEVIARDKQINQRNWLVARETNMILRDVIIAKKMNVTLEDAHHYFMISKQLERIGDHARLIGKQMLNILKMDLPAELYTKMKIASKESMHILSDCLRAWESKTRKTAPSQSIKLANESIERNQVLKQLCEEITKIHIQDAELYVSLNYIAESLRRTGDYSVNIAEIVIDNLIKEVG
ncbi:MAG: AbrB/MazE/SpoVT family DNA-binding domain-containing protein [Candidatus Lokiarchaeota archaeon]|nr:AbrB/MazE/SpoVT family DNA-binding domain-containing protein [Candidatus Lokiarchaeota archaeon]